MITLVNGHVQNASSLAVPNGCISFSLNIDATVIASPGGFVCADIPIVFQLDSNGDLIQPAMLWSNLELNPQNSMGLGTYYLVTVYNQNGARLNVKPMWWQFPQGAGATVDISQMAPFETVGGNVIFYPVVPNQVQSLGTPSQASNFVLSGWGSGAYISAVRGFDVAHVFTVVSGSNPSANPTITYTFANGVQPAVPVVQSLIQGGTGEVSDVQVTETTSGYVLTFLGTPQPGQTYIFASVTTNL